MVEPAGGWTPVAHRPAPGGERGVLGTEVGRAGPTNDAAAPAVSDDGFVRFFSGGFATVHFSGKHSVPATFAGLRNTEKLIERMESREVITLDSIQKAALPPIHK